MFLSNQAEALSKGLTLKEFDIYDLKSSGIFPQQGYIFDEATCQIIIEHFEKGSTFHPVGIQGKSDVTADDQIGSHRITVHDEHFAKYLTKCLWESLQFKLVPIVFDEFSPVDWQSNNPQKLNYWIPLHVSPVFRYMRYKKNGKHAVHYDATHKVTGNPLIRTVQSGVLYLTNNDVSTRFIEDYQGSLPFKKRNHDDWTEDARDCDILESSVSEEGKVLLFPHYLPHDVSQNFKDDERIIIRFDIFYQAIGKV